MKLEQRLEQKLEQKLTYEQRLLLEDAKKSIGYIEFTIQDRTHYEYKDGKIVKIIDTINLPDEDNTPDVYEIISRH
jgi:hypothetical protein|tara:strand:- start:698 stop:925 length:228 start_codon:yes stop_codon:yes gene_type:complete